ncbi:hypothetical protein HAX54_022273 [Datura stramonium]|uniref:Uncharacterized protein n=1 Tax=Datura stramonium TaxID=4076 RepID=A0ABS8S470_DATST|nr:hypothetical protein [Datura stramonium]
MGRAPEEVRCPPPFRSGRSTAPELEATIRSDWIWSYPTQPRNLERPACLDGCVKHASLTENKLFFHDNSRDYKGRGGAVLEHNVDESPFPYGRDIDNYPKEAYYSADRSGEPAMITKLTKAAAYANLNHRSSRVVFPEIAVSSLQNSMEWGRLELFSS